MAKKKSYTKKIVLTVAVLIAAFGLMGIMNNLEGPLVGSIAVNQLEDSNVVYASSTALYRAIPKIQAVTGIAALVILYLMWMKPINKGAVRLIKVIKEV